MRPPLFTVSNHHAISPQRHEPPSADGDESGTYHSYFENAVGDQSLFLYRRQTREAVVYSGDAGWTAFPVADGRAHGLTLSSEEEVWLQACLRAVGRAS